MSEDNTEHVSLDEESKEEPLDLNESISEGKENEIGDREVEQEQDNIETPEPDVQEEEQQQNEDKEEDEFDFEPPNPDSDEIGGSNEKPTDVVSRASEELNNLEVVDDTDPETKLGVPTAIEDKILDIPEQPVEEVAPEPILVDVASSKISSNSNKGTSITKDDTSKAEDTILQEKLTSENEQEEVKDTTVPREEGILDDDVSRKKEDEEPIAESGENKLA